MLNIRDLKIDNASLGKPLLLVEVRPYSDYKDGKPTEGVTGYRYDVCLAEHRLEKLTVKIEGAQFMENPEDGAVEVEFTGLEVRAYQERDQGKPGAVKFTARATGIKPVNGARKPFGPDGGGPTPEGKR